MAQPVNATELLAALESVAAGNIPTAVCNDNSLRERLRDASRKAAFRLEDAHDTIYRIAWEAVQLPVCKLAIDLGVFDAVVGGPELSGVTLAALIDKTGAEPALLKRTMDFLASHSMVEEIDQELYTPTNVTRNLTEKGCRGAVTVSHHASPAFHATPLFLSQTGYKSPTDPANCPLQLGLDTSDTFFPWLTKQPAILAAFNDYMAMNRLIPTEFYGIYPFDKLFEKSKADDVLFVDVGGNIGHQCARLLGSLPRAIRGRVILQDLPSVLSSIAVSNPSLPSAVEAMPHDFFTEQPIRNAWAYYFRNIFHDHPDDKAVAILEHTASAMGPRSVLLIDEVALAEKGAHWKSTDMDFVMMGILAAVERTEKQWASLLAKAGLKLVKLWHYGNRGQAIIECKVTADSD